MTLTNAFFAEPRFLSTSPDFETLKATTELSLQTPGVALALAFDYYRVEAFSTADARERACGATGCEDVKYFPADRDAILDNVDLLEVACGHSLGEAGFEDVIAPIFRRVLQEVIRDASNGSRNDPGSRVVSNWPITVARVRYNLKLMDSGEWLNFEVDAIKVFEEWDRDLVDRTIQYLQDQLVEQLSPFVQERALA